MAEAQTDAPVEQRNYLDMSDEDILKMDAPSHETPVAAAASTDVVVADDATRADDQIADGLDEDDENKDDAKDAADAAGDSQAAEGAADATTDKPKEKTEVVDALPADKVVENTTPAVVNFEDEYKRLLAPFKANGKDIQVKNVDDAIGLMQMGANYNKKMAALKPSLKLMKMLENNGLLSEEKIGYLIDLEKKIPGAVNRLVNESGIDPMEFDAEKAKAYKQTAYAVDDREIELDTVLDELQGTPTYTRTLDVVSNKWDVASKQAVSQSPQLLKVINDHVASGIYDLISSEVERERVFGRLNGMSDIEAYRQVGDALHASGGFNHLGKPQANTTPVTPAPVVVQPKPKAVEDDKLKDKRRAASSTRPAAPTVMAKDFNPLNLSDAEFSKLAHPRYS